MTPRAGFRARAALGGLGAAVALFAPAALPGAGVRTAAAQGKPEIAVSPTPAPWRPAGLDSARLWCLEARAILVGAKSDTIGPDEARAYHLLDRVTESALRGLGADGMRGAPAVLAVFDSLKLDVEMAQDPAFPQFVVVTYFNPAFAGYACWSRIFWWRGDDLMSQAIALQGGRKVQMAVWFTGNELGPYEMAIVDFRRSGDPHEGYFTLLRLSRHADFWGAVQYGRKSFSLGGPGPARLVDLNFDGVPELVNWVRAEPDPRFVADANLPPLLSEQTWQRTDDGFLPLDRRTVPTPFAVLVLFLRALSAGQLQLARSLCTTPAPFLEAQRLKLGLVKAKNSWHVGETPAPEPWRSDFALGYGTPGHLDHELRVIFKEVEEHWLIDTIRAPRVPKGATP